MRAKEIMSKGKPTVYLDMDGVLADFFAGYASVAGMPAGSTHKDIPAAKNDPTLQKIQGTDFFARLPKYASADALVSMVVSQFGSYSICSSPLRDDHENSEKWKRVWIQQHLSPQPREIVITSQKQKFALQPDGTPNILIDDRGANIVAWEAKGGIGIKYQADEDSLSVVAAGLERAKGTPATDDTVAPATTLKESTSIQHHKENFISMFEKFLPIAMRYIGLTSLPKMNFESHVEDTQQPTFGKYENGSHVLHVSLMNRHPNDILRTIAHELVHYKQDTEHQLDSDSGRTGSPVENEANAVAGIVMRHFNKQYPQYLSSKPVTEHRSNSR